MKSNSKFQIICKMSIFPMILLFSFFLIPTQEILANDIDQHEEQFIEGDIILQLDGTKPITNLVNGFSNINLRPVRQLSRRMNIWLFSYDYSGFTKADHGSVLQDVQFHSDILVAQFNHVISKRAIPDDTEFGQQWGLHNTGQSGGTVDADIDAPEAWDITTSGTTALGDQIVIAIIDGGFDLNHVDIPYWKNTDEIPGNGIDDDANGYIDDYDGWNVYGNNGNIPSDDHGTHVAGIAAAAGNNAQGVSGVNWNAKIMPIAGSSTQEVTVVAAYSYIHELRSTYNETDGISGAFVVSTNASFGVDFGDPASYPLWCGIYDSLGNIGILSAGATANINIDIDAQGDVPTACASDYMVAVTNTTRTDVKNSGAAYGTTTIDLGAPGTSVYATLPGSSYGNKTGTSMATPHVAGAIGLMYAAACPAMIQQYRNDPGGIALIMKQYLLDGTDPNTSLQGITVSGGRLNLYNSLLLVQSFPCGVTITHDGLPDTKNTTTPYEVVCEVLSEVTLHSDSLLLYFRTNGGAYSLDTLTATGTADEYSGFIPAQSPGTVVEYYLEAHATDGDADTTAVFSFRVIDYAVTLDPAELNGSGPSQTDVWYDLSVINDGVLSDSYNLTTSNNIWATTFWDETMTTQISSVGPLAADDTVAIKVKVEIPSTIYGDNDLCNARATSQADGLIFTTTVVRTISAGQPIALPFFDAFTTTVVDPANWVQSSGIAINTVGLSEPSEPNSANLNGDPSGADTLMSQAIDLSGLGGGVNISYHYQQTGGGDSPEASDDLFVEYFNDQGQWTILNQHLGADGDMTVFESYTTGVPLDGYHAAFRLRFRNIATSGSYDDWFVDNIRVDFGPAISASPASYAVTLAADDSTTDQLIIENAGPGGLSYSVNVAPDFGKMNNLFANLYQANETASSRSASPDEWVDYQEPKGGIDFRQGAAVDKNAGGPDGYGYIWIDSDEAGGPSFVWTDISTTGTDITAGLDDDNFVGPFTIGFDFPLYDSSFSEFYVGSNGLIGFGSLTGFGERNNTTIPSGSAPNNMICWCWDDLDITNGSNPNGKVYSELVGSDLVIQYVDYPEYQATAGDVITAQVILSPNGSIKIQYLSIGSSFDTQAATVGIENYTGTDGLQIAFNTAYLHDSLAIEIVKPSQWLFLSGNSGDLLAGESDTLVVNFNSTGLADGVYLSNITINSNDPDPVDNPMLISAELTVDDGPQYICGDADQSTEVDISDAVYLIAYIFSGGPSPDPWQAGDADCSGELDISDAVYLIAFIFNSGPAPCESCI